MKNASRQYACVIVAAAALAAPLAASASEPPGTAPPAFSVHDLNRDGYLDRPEYERMRAECVARRSGRSHRPCALEFSAMDADGDGRIAEQELLAALERAPGRHRWRSGVPAPSGEPEPVPPERP